jgi:parallel beta-helix repeat protein
MPIPLSIQRFYPVLLLLLSLTMSSSCYVYYAPTKKKAATVVKPKENKPPAVVTPPQPPVLSNKETINILDFGAKPNDNIDDATAIQAALTAANKTGAKTVRIPLGTFNIEKSAVNIYGNVRIVGDTLANGTRPTIQSNTTQNNSFFLGYAYEYDNISIENLNFTISSKQIAKNLTALQFGNSNTLGWKSRKIFVKNCKFGANFNAILSSRNAETITNCVFDASITGIRLTGTRNCTIARNRFLNNTAGCLLFSNRDATTTTGEQDAGVNTNINIIDNFFYKPVHCYPIHLGTEGEKKQPNGTMGNNAPYKNVLIANNTVMGSFQIVGRDSIPVEYARCGMDCGNKKCNIDKDGTADQISVHHNTEGLLLFNNTTLFSGDMGITLYECSNGLVVANTSRRNTASGIIVHGSKKIIIAHNNFSDNGQNVYQNIDTKNRCTSFFAHAGLCIAALHTQSSDDITLYENLYDISKKKVQKYNISIVDKGLTNLNIQEKEVSINEIETQNSKMPVKIVRNPKSTPTLLANKTEVNVSAQNHLLSVAAAKTTLNFTHQNGSTDIYNNAYFIQNPSHSSVILRVNSNNKNLPINGQNALSLNNTKILLYYDTQTQTYKTLMAN